MHRALKYGANAYVMSDFLLYATTNMNIGEEKGAYSQKSILGDRDKNFL